MHAFHHASGLQKYYPGENQFTTGGVRSGVAASIIHYAIELLINGSISKNSTYSVSLVKFNFCGIAVVIPGPIVGRLFRFRRSGRGYLYGPRSLG